MKSKTLCLILIGIAVGSISARAEDHSGHAEHKGHEHAEKEQAEHVDKDEHAEEGKHEEHEEGAIKLSDEVLREFGIEVKTAGTAEIALETTLPGEILINQDRLAHVVPRYPGVVLEVRKNIGDTVIKGEVVAILEGNDSLTPYPLKSMIDGVVIDKHITLGEGLQTDRSVYTIADLSEVWVSVTLYQKDLLTVRKGFSAVISGGEHLSTAAGIIDYVSPTLDQHTRTGYARLVLPNADALWKPGMFITARVKVGSESPAVVIPKTALQTLEHGVSVFVQTEEGFEPREVELGKFHRTRVEIVSGLQPGETYVSEGGFTLKAELGRGEMDSGHSH